MFSKATKILVVDDMAAMRLRIINQLKSMEFSYIEQASNGQEAYDILEKRIAENNPIDLVISDWNMPVMSGIDFLVKLRAHAIMGKTPFLMVTAEGEKQQVIKALSYGVSEYLIKPVNKLDLQKKLSSIWTKNSAA